MLAKKNLAWAVLAPLLMTACTASQTQAINNQINTVTKSINKSVTKITSGTVKTPDMDIGERARVEDLGFEKAQYEHLLPTSNDSSQYDFKYQSAQAEIKKIKGFDLVKTPYAYTNNPQGVRYAILALVDPKTKEVAHSSIRIVSSTGTGDFIVDNSITEQQRKQALTRDFRMAIDANGRVFDLKEAPGGAKDYCTDKGCRYERAYDLKISPKFLFYYANGGALNLVSDNRPVVIYLPKEMMVDFYNGLKVASR